MTLKFLMFAFLLTSRAPAADSHYCDSNGNCSAYKVAHTFAPFEEMIPKQAQLLIGAGISDRISAGGGSTVYENWTVEHDDQAAAYLAVTRVLGLLKLSLENGAAIWALDLVVVVKKFEGDRIRVTLDRRMVERWQAGGAGFTLYRADGKNETGKMKWKTSGDLGGSLHKGYEVQAYTSASSMPRVQINYRRSDDEADIDIDGFAPLIWGFVPNPIHLTYKNSDPRQWYDQLVKKAGYPGFKVRPY